MIHPLGTLRDAFKLMQDLLDDKDSLLALNEKLWKRYDRLIGSLRDDRRMNAILARFLAGDARLADDLCRLETEEIDRVFALRDLPAPGRFCPA